MNKLDDMLANTLERLTRLERKVRNDSVRDAAGGYWLSLAPYSILPGTDITVTGSVSHLQAIPRDCTAKKFVFSSYTRTTNNSGNHWNVQFVNFDLSTVWMTQQSLQADTVNTWTHHIYTDASFAVTAAVASTDVQFLCRLVKVGAPGAILIGGVNVFFV